MGEILSMEEIRRKNQLSLVVYPIIYRVLYIPSSDRRISEASNIGVVCFSAASFEKKQPAAEMLFQLEAEIKKGKSVTGSDTSCGTVDGQNPAPPRMMSIPLFIGF